MGEYEDRIRRYESRGGPMQGYRGVTAHLDPVARDLPDPAVHGYFWRTRVTINRPYSGLTPLGVTKIIIEAETRGVTADDAKAAAVAAARELIGGLDHVTSTDVEFTG
jgi:hypothetical protein